METWDVVLYLHLLAMAFFVGGQLVVAVAVVPELAREGDREPMRRVARRFGWGSLCALVVLLATGIAMAEHYALWSSKTLQIKLGVVAAVIALTLVHLRFPRAHALQGLILVGSLVIVWLGADLGG